MGNMRIAICPFDGVGHLNPLLAIASKLAHRGHLCRFYLMSDTFEASINSVPFPNVDVSRLYEEGGAHFSSLVPKHEDQDATDIKVSDLPVALVAHAYKYMPRFIEGLREFEADLIIYDPFVLSSVVAASILDLPCVSTITVSNFNQYTLLCDRHTEEEKALGIEEHKQSKTLSKYHKLFLEKYYFDIFSRVVLLNNYLPQGLNLCSGIKDFEQKMPEVVKPVYGDMDKDCLYVGPMLLSKEEGRSSVSMSPFPTTIFASTRSRARKSSTPPLARSQLECSGITRSFRARCLARRRAARSFAAPCGREYSRPLEGRRTTWWSWPPLLETQRRWRVSRFLATSSFAASVLSSRF